MDRPLEKRVRYKKLLKRFGPAFLLTVLAVVVLTSAFGWLKPSVRRTEIRTCSVERGPVEATITASGTVVPEYEHVVTSPVDTRVSRILKNPGDPVDAGEQIVELDVSEARLDLDRVDDRISLKQVEREKAKLDLAGKVNDWRNESEIKTVELEYLDYEAERCRNYQGVGLFTLDDLRKAEKDAERARIELRQIQETIAHAEQALATELRRLDLEIGILRKERADAARRLDLALGTTDRAGVLTWVVRSEGTAVRRGDEIARVADLSAFRVEVTVSDIHGERMAPGLPVLVRSGDTTLHGRVANVLPMVENGVITMEVTLEEKRHPVLRQNLRVEVFVVTAREENALRVCRGQFLNVDGTPAVFVVRGDKAERTEVRFGLKNFEYYQILEGLHEGDEIILSDMEDHQHTREVKIR